VLHYDEQKVGRTGAGDEQEGTAYMKAGTEHKVDM